MSTTNMNNDWDYILQQLPYHKRDAFTQDYYAEFQAACSQNYNNPEGDVIGEFISLARSI